MKKNYFKQTNNQFYKYWKKEAKEWRKSFIVTRIGFYRLKKWTDREEKPVYKVIEKLLNKNIEVVSFSDIRKIEDLLGCRIKTSKLRFLLEFAGYHYRKRQNEFYLVEGRREQVLNACNATKVWWDSAAEHNVKEKIANFKYSHWNKKVRKYEEKRDNIAVKYRINAYKLEPANGERLDLLSKLFSRLLAIMIIIAVAIVCWRVVTIYSNPSEFKEEALDFWSTLFAACIPGIVTVFTTYLLINHEYKVDYHNERTAVLPVFSVTLEAKTYLLDDRKIKRKFRNNFINTAEIDDLHSDDVDIFKLTNIGYGIGFNVRHDRKDQVFSFGDIERGKDCYIAIRKRRQLCYMIEYSDLYGNKYTQRFEVENSNEMCSVTSYPPVLVLRTKRVRYQQ